MTEEPPDYSCRPRCSDDQVLAGVHVETWTQR